MLLSDYGIMTVDGVLSTEITGRRVQLVELSAAGLFSPGFLVHVMDCRARAVLVGNSLSAKYCFAFLSSICDTGVAHLLFSFDLRYLRAARKDGPDSLRLGVRRTPEVENQKTTKNGDDRKHRVMRQRHAAQVPAREKGVAKSLGKKHKSHYVRSLLGPKKSGREEGEPVQDVQESDAGER